MLLYFTRTNKSIAHPRITTFKTLLLEFSTTTSPNPPQPNHIPLVADYLITNFNFPKDRAISASKYFPPSTSHTTLTIVPQFLKQNGFTHTHIQTIISKEPRYLHANFPKVLQPKLNLLENQLGFSGPSLIDLIVTTPIILFRDPEKSIIPTITILRSFLRSNDNIIKILKRNSWILSPSYLNAIGHNVEFFRKCGVSEKRVICFLLNQPRFFSMKPETLHDLIDKVEKMGVKSDTGPFMRAIHVFYSMNKATLEEKFKLYRSYGWLESDILSAFKKAPDFLTLSKEKIAKTLNFFKEELSYDPKDIAQRPKLLVYSLEKRLRPRSNVLKILNSKGLLKRNICFASVSALPETTFFENYVVNFLSKAPELEGAYKGSNTL